MRWTVAPTLSLSNWSGSESACTPASLSSCSALDPLALGTAKSIAARAWMVALQALGVEDAGDLTSLEAFGIVPIDDDGAHLPERGVMDLAISSAAQAIERAAARLGNGRD